MAISRKPVQDKSLVNKIIGNGGSVASDRNNKSVRATTLNIPINLIDRVDALIRESEIPTTRHAFILGAILEKVKSIEND